VTEPGELLLHELVEAQVERTPGAVAIRFEGEALTYRELNERANRLAHRLVELGTGPNCLVGVSLDRSLEMTIALLAALKAGGAYVPIDPRYPVERRAFMLADSRPCVLLTQKNLQAAQEVPTLCVDQPGTWSQEPATNPGRRCGPDDLAYVIYTSGSTGKPKGVEITHRAIVNHQLWMEEAFKVTPADRFLQLSPFSFDASVCEFFSPLAVGGCVVMARPGGQRDSAYQVKVIVEERITAIQLVPAMLRAFLDVPGVEACRSLARVIAGGEALPLQVCKLYRERKLGATLYNTYGPTEAAIDATWCVCDPKWEDPNVPIGRPVKNLRAHVLDAGLRPVPAGDVGELNIGGVGLARAYLNRPELTVEKFIPDQLSGQPGARLYKTGDLARIRSDGLLEYLGRTDQQVKVRGQRIELGEIESALLRHPRVREAVVVANREGTSDRLVAYVVPMDFPAAPAELKAHLEKTLAPYMVPAAFVSLSSLPLTPSLKVDRKALPSPPHESEGFPPRDMLEQQLALIWQDALHVEAISVREDLFAELGADSMAAVSAVAKIHEALGVELPPEVLLAHATIERQANVLRERAPSRANAPLVTLAAGPAKPDLYLMHAAGVDAFAYVPLVRKLAGAHSVHVLQNPYRCSGDGMYPSVHTMADAYTDVIREHQPRGPYRLGGWSLGASVAFEVALRLVAAGERVTGVVMFDPDRPVGPLTRTTRRLRAWLSHARYALLDALPSAAPWDPGTRKRLELLQTRAPLARLGSWLHALAMAGADARPVLVERIFPGHFASGELRAIGPDRLWDVIYERVKARSGEGTLGGSIGLQFGIPGTTPGGIRQRARVFARENEIGSEHVPSGVYNGRLTIFMQRGSTDGPTWARHATEPLELEEFDLVAIPGLGDDVHNAMMMEPNVVRFADSFRSFMQRTNSA
jgi:amino acid adenylation domain-containing protein